MSEFVMSLPPAADEACAVHFCWEQDYQNLCSEVEAEDPLTVQRGLCCFTL